MAFPYRDLPTQIILKFLSTDNRAALLKTTPTTAIWNFLELEAPLEVIRYAFEKEGQNINLTDRKADTGDTFLHFVVRQHNLNLVEYFASLIDANTTNDLNETPLSLAVSNQYHDLIFPLSFLSSVEEFDLNIKNFSNGNTALHFAILNNAYHTVCSLLFAGANAEIKNTKGITPLHFAIQQGNIEIVKKLLENVDPNTQSAGATPLYWATVIYNHPEIAALLRGKGATETFTTTPNYLPSSGLVFGSTKQCLAPTQAPSLLLKNT